MIRPEYSPLAHITNMYFKAKRKEKKGRTREGL